MYLAQFFFLILTATATSAAPTNVVNSTKSLFDDHARYFGSKANLKYDLAEQHLTQAMHTFSTLMERVKLLGISNSDAVAEANESFNRWYTELRNTLTAARTQMNEDIEVGEWVVENVARQYNKEQPQMSYFPVDAIKQRIMKLPEIYERARSLAQTVKKDIDEKMNYWDIYFRSFVKGKSSDE